MASLDNTHTSIACILMSCVLLAACVAPSNHMVTAFRDPTYLHCGHARGEFSISELHHSVRQYSARTGSYVSLCRDCTVAEWDDRIVLHDDRGTFITIDRISGEANVRRSTENSISGDARDYHGTCKLGERMGPGEAAGTITRAF